MVIVALITPALTVNAKTGWKTYTDPCIGYSIAYPDFLDLIPWTVLHPEAEPTSSAQWRTKTFRSSVTGRCH
jgi:hypothetical protein